MSYETEEEYTRLSIIIELEKSHSCAINMMSVYNTCEFVYHMGNTNGHKPENTTNT